MFTKFSPIRNSRGFAVLFATMIILAAVLVVASGLTLLTLTEKKITQNSLISAQAYLAAESGVEDSLYRIIKGKKYQATNSLTIASSTAAINISGDSVKTIRINGQENNRWRNLQVILNVSRDAVSFHYGAQVDQGGLQIQPNAKVIGNVYSNGSIKGGGGSSIITGDAWVAGGLSPEPNQQWTVQNSDFSFGLKIGTNYILDTAQSFIPSESKVLNKVSFYLKKVGNPPDQTIRILTDNNGQPSNTSLGSGILKTSKVTSSYSWTDVSLDPAPNLISGQTYWVMIDTSRDNNNYWVWGKDSADGYSSGTGKYSKDWTDSKSVWLNVNGDLNFKTWMGGIVTAIDNTWIGVDAYANAITNSSIGRDAYYQSIENTTVLRNKYPNSPNPSTKDLPISYAQIQDWKKAAEAGGIINGDYTPSKGSLLGPVKINGNLTFPSNSADNPVIITGSVWATGKILAANNAGIKLKEGLSYGYPVIADNPDNQNNYGQIEFNNNVITQDSSQGGLLLFISTNKSLDINSPAIWLYNNVNKDKAQSIIFSLSGLIKVENNAKFKEITGYAIYLSNNAEIVYETGLINTNFSSGPGAGWLIESWQEVP